MPHSPILQPVTVLILWTMCVWLWMYATRIPAMHRAGLDVVNMRGGKGTDLDEVLPAKTQWKSHNYNHLLAEPTVFYAVCFVLALIGMGDGLNLVLAWVYVALRIVHSLIQATVNRVMFRFAAFAASSLCLISLGIRAAVGVFP